MATVLRVLVRIFFTPLLVFLIGALFVSCVAVEAAERHLLNAEFYLDALDENDAYGRVLDEFLLEVEQAETTDKLIAHTDTTTEEMSGLVREIVRTSWLQEEVERNVRTLFSYLRDETDELSLFLEVGPVLDRMQSALSTFVIAQLGEIRTEPVSSFDEYKNTLSTLLETVENGDAVVILPSYELSASEREEIIELIFDPTGELADSAARSEVDAALRRGDTAGALIAVVDELIATRLDEATTELREKLDRQERLDLVAEIADDEGKSTEEVLAELADARRAVGWITGGGRFVFASAIVLLAGLLGLTYLPSRLWSLVVPGVVLAGWASLGLFWWMIHKSAVPIWSRNRVIENDTELSDSGVSLVADIAETLARESANAALRPSFALLILGIVAIAGGIVLNSRREPATAGETPLRERSPDTYDPAIAGRPGSDMAQSAEDEPDNWRGGDAD